MSDVPTLVIPFASAANTLPSFASLLPSLQLPCLEKLITRLSPQPTLGGDPESLTPPHERVLAELHGISAPDGLVPWAALQALALGLPGAADGAWATITPCHWQMGSAHVDMPDPAALQLTEAESQALMAAMQTYFTEDGISLHYVAPTTWLARGEWFRGLATASLDRVAGHRVDDWMPRAAAASGLRRLQNEMQMLLYTHAVNDVRTERRLPPVNSFWASGTGVLPANYQARALADTSVPRGLADAVRREDPMAWTAAWQAIDAEACADLLKKLDNRQAVVLTLCGESRAQTWTSAGGGLRQRIANLFKPQRLAAVLEAL